MFTPPFEMSRHAIPLLIALFVAPGCRPLFSRSIASNPPPQSPQPEELVRDEMSVWSLSYSSDGALLLSSHLSRAPSNSRSCCLCAPVPTKFELWGAGFLALGQPQGQLATFSS